MLYISALANIMCSYPPKQTLSRRVLESVKLCRMVIIVADILRNSILRLENEM